MNNDCDPSADGLKVVPGEGPPDARIMLVGQNPGAEEEKAGRPFVGRSGRYLDRVLQANHLDRRRIYITSPVKHRTPGNRKPTAAEIALGMSCLLEELKRVRPEVVVLMGQVAWQTPRLEGIRFIETYHPAAAMRFPKARQRFEEDFRQLAASYDEAYLSRHQG